MYENIVASMPPKDAEYAIGELERLAEVWGFDEDEIEYCDYIFARCFNLGKEHGARGPIGKILAKASTKLNRAKAEAAQDKAIAEANAVWDRANKEGQHV